MTLRRAYDIYLYILGGKEIVPIERRAVAQKRRNRTKELDRQARLWGEKARAEEAHRRWLTSAGMGQ